MDNSTESSLLSGRILRVLIVEDLPEDAELIARHLGQAGYAVEIRRVVALWKCPQPLRRTIGTSLLLTTGSRASELCRH